MSTSRKVFAGNLSFDITREQLETEFGEAGPVVDVVMPMDRVSGRPRGFAFVEYQTEEGAEKAIELLNGKEIAGRKIRVDEAKERAPRPPRDFGGGGGPPPFDPGQRPFKNKGSRRNIRKRKRGF
jgi:RNA recognition motif-containing protein